MNNNTDYCHKTYIERCLQLAKLGMGTVAPNPMVGAVIVHQGQIIGEGWHQQYGQAHAERNAVANIAPHLRHLLPQSTLYVSLEPCAHYGKTPPCADYIIECAIKRVVVACGDPFEQVAGKGIEKLKNAGVEVIEQILEKEAKWLNRRFFTFHQQQRPYIILKWAQTQNGYFAPNNGTQQWISNAQCQTLSHQWRTQEAAIMVGTNTARIDNPQLNARLWQGKQPLRIVIDRHLILPPSLHLFDGTQKTLVFAHNNAQNQAKWQQFAHQLPKPHALSSINCAFLDPEADSLPQIWQYLYQQNIQSVIVEGGAQWLQSIIQSGVWDEARLFIAPQQWQSGMAAPTLPPQCPLINHYKIGNNELVVKTKS